MPHFVAIFDEGKSRSRSKPLTQGILTSNIEIASIEEPLFEIETEKKKESPKHLVRARIGICPNVQERLDNTKDLLPRIWRNSHSLASLKNNIFMFTGALGADGSGTISVRYDGQLALGAMTNTDSLLPNALRGMLGEKLYEQLRAYFLYWMCTLTVAGYDFLSPAEIIGSGRDRIRRDVSVIFEERPMRPLEPQITRQTPESVEKEHHFDAHTRLLPAGFKPSPDGWQRGKNDKHLALWAKCFDTGRTQILEEIRIDQCEDYPAFRELAAKLEEKYGIKNVRYQTFVSEAKAGERNVNSTETAPGKFGRFGGLIGRMRELARGLLGK